MRKSFKQNGYSYQLVESTRYGFIYEVSHQTISAKFYEVFENRDFGGVSVYPDDDDFGEWAFSVPTLKDAYKKLHEFERTKQATTSAERG